MIEQLRSGGDQLYAALNNYSHAYSTIQDYHTRGKAPYAYGFPPDLTHQLDTELARISSYEAKIKQVKASVSNARNYSPGLSPIGSLPLEILIRILRLVISQPCKSIPSSPIGKRRSPECPEDLAQVCAFWRKAIISSHPLWRHIDLITYEPGYSRVINRAGAETHVERAGDLPIEIHIADNQHLRSGDGNGDYSDLYDFVSRISSRAESLEFDIGGYFQAFHRAVLHALWSNQRSGLTKLVMRSDNKTYVYPEDLAHDESDREIGDPESSTFGSQLQIGNALARLTNLHLHGILLPWESTANSELVDLRLISNRLEAYIPEAALIQILNASPRLQILHFGLSIRNLTPLTEEITSVHLKKLQVIKLFTFGEYGEVCT